MNTGRVIYTHLRKVYKGITDEYGNSIPVLDCFGNEIKKCNVEGDVDYIPPTLNPLLCPTDFPVTTTVNFTTTTSNFTTTVTTTSNATTTANCNFNINSADFDCSNPSYITIEVNTTITSGTVNALIVNTETSITRNNLTVVNGSVYFNLPYSMVGDNIIEINYMGCTRLIQLSILCNNILNCNLLNIICNQSTTSSTSTTTTTTSSTSTTSTTSTTVDVTCNLTSVTASQILPNQIKIDYVGTNVSSWSWQVLQSGTILEAGNVTSWTGNTFYLNLLTPLCNGTYTVKITPSNCATLFKETSVTITDSICCTVAITSVTNLSPTKTRVVYTVTGVANIDWEIIKGTTSVQAGAVNVVSGINTTEFDHAPLVNGNYAFKLSKGVACFDTEAFAVNTTTVTPCLFTLGTPIVTLASSGLSYDFNIPISNSQPNYTITIFTEDMLLVSVQGSPNGVFSLLKNMGGIDISNKVLTIQFLSEPVGCTKSVDVNMATVS